MGFGGPPSSAPPITTAGGDSTLFTDPKMTNPPFAYPRYMPRDNLIQRGYMRLLGQVLQANLGTVPDSHEGNTATAALYELGAKLDFQFNPNQLSRSVTARTDTQLWINQSPSELLTPGLGDMSFQWQMLFNREEEVQRYYNARGRWSKSGWHAETANSRSLDELIKDPAEPQVAERIGILADIMVLDQITGQRLTEAAIEFSKKWSLVRPEDGTEVSPEEPLSAERQESLLNANLTNAAFLIPNPIRVVFSENFMVDGYVNQVSVSIQKFSPDMVPTVGTVDISMHALYQGFARRSTVFTALAKQIREDDTIIVGENPFESENANEEATDAADASHDLQDLGMMGTPMFAGFDHSPQHSGRFSGDRGSMKMDRWQSKAGGYKTTTLPEPGDTDKDAPRGGISLKCQHNDSGKNAITFGIVSNLRDSSLGKFLRDNGDARSAKDWFGTVKSRLHVAGYVGLALRARLKADSLADLQVLWEDGDENGFSTFYRAGQTYATGVWGAHSNTDNHFFDSWDTAQRELLFAVGVDAFSQQLPTNSGSGLRTTAFNVTNTQTSGFYTRSFPITEVDANFPGYYGDNFYKHYFEYGPSQIGFQVGNSDDEGWVWCGDRQGQDIQAEQWDFNIARGFYTTGDSPFPDELELINASTNAVDYTYKIQYQQALTLRVRVTIDKPQSMGGAAAGRLPISDTGILWMYPRKEATGIINDVDGEGHTDRGVAGSITLDGFLRGDEDEVAVWGVPEGLWLNPENDKEGLSNDMFYDGLYKHDGNEHPENIRQYGFAFDRANPSAVSLGGMRISSRDILANNHLIEF